MPTQEHIDSINALCKQYKIDYYIINDDGSIDVNGSVFMHNKEFKQLPLSFNKVSGDFWCYSNFLTTLEGCPREVGGTFNCSWNDLSSLNHAPKIVAHVFLCEDNNELGDHFNNTFSTMSYNDTDVFLKYHQDYEVWNPDFNVDNFNDLLLDINEGLA